MKSRAILVSCGGPDPPGSLSIRSDNLASLKLFEGCKCHSSKHTTAIAGSFILTMSIGRSHVLLSTNIAGLVPKGECALPSDVECVDSDGSYLAAGSSDGTVRLWRVSDGELLIEQHLHIGSISVVRIDPIMWVLFAASVTGRIGAWSIPGLFSCAEADRIWSIHTLKVSDLCISHGKRVYSVSLDKTAKCFDFAVGCEILAVNFPAALNCCALLNNESVLFCGGVDGNIYQIGLVQDFGLLPVLQGHGMDVCDLLVSDDDRALFSCSLDASVRRWDVATGSMIGSISDIKGVPFALKFLPEIDAAGPSAAATQKKKTRREAIAGRQELKKGFPRLQRTVAGNRDEIVSAPVEEVDILTIEEEMAIAVADVCQHQPMVLVSGEREERPDERGQAVGDDGGSFDRPLPQECKE
jgi:WD40 repeat protein